MRKEHNNIGKAPLSWGEEDYRKTGEIAPDCLKQGKTEGEAFTEEDVETWLREELQTLYVLKDEYPKRYSQHKELLVSDLEYLCSLGKISIEDKEEIIKLEL